MYFDKIKSKALDMSRVKLFLPPKGVKFCLRLSDYKMKLHPPTRQRAHAHALDASRLKAHSRVFCDNCVTFMCVRIFYPLRGKEYVILKVEVTFDFH